jgi:hypothetical protein
VFVGIRQIATESELLSTGEKWINGGSIYLATIEKPVAQMKGILEKGI